MITPVRSFNRRLIPAVIISAALISCGEENEKAFVTAEISMAGDRHDLRYSGDSLVSIAYTTFITHSETDTAQIDTVIRRDVDSLLYEEGGSIALWRAHSRHSAAGKIHRRYYFNSDNLLVRITRFSGKTEYTTDSVSYDYTSGQAFYHDLINKEVDEIEYDREDNIASVTRKRLSTGQVVSTIYNYFTTSRDPYLLNLDDDTKLFGCFNRTTVTLFWNGGLRPQFHSAKNVQATK